MDQRPTRPPGPPAGAPPPPGGTALELNDILKIALKGAASDIHLKAGLPPMFRIDGDLVPLKDAKRLVPEELNKMALRIMKARRSIPAGASVGFTSRRGRSS